MLKAVKPHTITDAVVVSISEPETEHAAWSTGVTYALGDQRIYAHRIYRSLQGTNLDHTPVGGAADTWWFDEGPTNAWAMFDGTISTATVAAGETLSVTLLPADRISTVALVNATGVTARCTMIVASVVVYEQERTINPGAAGDWWEYLFGDRTSAYTGDIVFDGIPPYTGAVLTIDIDRADVASLGALVIGTAFEVGHVNWGSASIELIDYSTKEIDAFGVATLVERAYADRPTYPLRINTGNVPAVRSFMRDTRATPCFWYLDDDDGSALSVLYSFGWHRGFSAQSESRDYWRADLQVEGLI